MRPRTGWRILSGVLIFSLLLFPHPVKSGVFDSLSVEKEKQIGEEFFQQLQAYYSISADPFICSYINRLGQKLVAQLDPNPYQFRFFVLDDPTMNAFAVPGGYIFVTTGFIRAMEREGELAGVLAHEISHIYARHLARQLDKSKVVNAATLVGALAAVLLGGAAAGPLLTGTMAAGETAMLKYSRDHEKEADSLGFKWMVRAGYNPRDMMAVFRKLGKLRWFEGGDLPVYLSTHPEVDTRLVDLSHQMASHAGKLKESPQSPEFQYFTLKVDVASSNPHQFLRRMTQASAKEPNNPAYRYGKALVLARLERPQEALAEFQEALKLDPGNSIIKRELAAFHFERNRYQEAFSLLEDLAQKYPQDEVTLYYLGRIYQERRQVDQALAAMERVHALNPAYLEVYHNLGTLYGEKGKLGLAHYFLGLYSLKARAYPTALFHFRKALVNLPPNDPHCGEVRSQIARLEKMRIRVN
uniref:Tetratricopeptide repeat protein n=1 Tax=Desulfobacca acetoxidans TaxID=60893 RepID=A0A7C5AMQ4_9BACT